MPANKEKTMLVKKTVFDLKTFADVTLGMELTPTPAFTTLAEALSFYGNDEAKVLKALNEDKVSKEVETAKGQPLSAFHAFEDEDETKLSSDPADVVPVNEKVVNDLVLNIAKQHFGFSKDAGPDNKRTAKTAALEYVRTNEALRGYLTVMSGPGPVSAASAKA